MSKLVLTPQIVKTTTCPLGKAKNNLFDSYCKGLSLEIRCTGGKTYYLRYTDGRGKSKQFKIADEKDISLSQARQLADKYRTQIALGIDPATEKTTLRQVPTFADFMNNRYMPYVKGYKRAWQADDSYLRHHLLPAFGKKHLDEITKHDVIQFHHGMRAKDYALGTCNRCLILLRYAMNLALRWEIPGFKANPTKDVALFEDLNKKERFLTELEAQKLYGTVCQSENPMLKYIVPMLILTGARKREVLDAKWEDFDVVRKQWRIPMTKTGRPVMSHYRTGFCSCWIRYRMMIAPGYSPTPRHANHSCRSSRLGTRPGGVGAGVTWTNHPGQRSGMVSSWG
jgi:integrase